MVVSILNSPWTLIGLVLAGLAIPKGVSKHSGTIVITVRSFWWSPIPNTRGVTLGNLIILHADAFEFTLKHEFIHLDQFRRHPFIFPFLYFFEFLRYGYVDNHFELEARIGEKNLLL